MFFNLIMLSHNSLIFEGPDGAGKNTLMLNIVNELVKDRNLIVTNFPQYFAFGALIRNMNRGKAHRVFMQMDDPYEEARHRAALFALDRVLAMSVILRFRQILPDSVHISDRGPDSNAVTAGYMWARNPSLSDIQLKKFIDEVIGTLDQEFRGLLMPIVILCLTSNGLDHSLNRETLDHLETDEAQQRSIEIYRQIIPQENIVYTKIGGEWRRPEETVPEVLAKSGLVSTDISKRGQLVLVGPKELAESIFKVIPQELLDLDTQWRKISLDPADEDGRRKFHLDQIETQISSLISNLILDTANLRRDYPEIIVQAVRRLLNSYPYLEDIIREVGGGAYLTLLQTIKGQNLKES
jgi:thymidylate kinase